VKVETNAIKQPAASISLDLDDLWTYLRTHGDPSWTSRPSFLDTCVPLVLDEFDRAGITITFFIVGSDAANPRNHGLLREIVDRGHELGNHSFEHEPWLQRYSVEALESEVARTEDILGQVTGQRPIGFRGPGYSWSLELLEILAQRGYLYDASTLPTYLGPLARAYYFWSAKLDAKERAERGALFGTFQDGTRPVQAYQWRLSGQRSLLEIPVTTFPVVKTPFHLSYLHYLSRISDGMALTYLRAALLACRLTKVSPSFILHPLDLLGADRVPQLRFFPAMDLMGEKKVELFRRVLEVYQASYRLVTMEAHARTLLAESRLETREPQLLLAAPSPIRDPE
jgi:hypothetical protein